MFTEIIIDAKVEICLTVCLLSLIYFLNYIIKQRRRNLPPGPIGIPVLGYIPFLTKDVHLDFMKLGEKYGEIFSLRLGSEIVVVLNGASAVREAFGKNEFLGRPPSSAFSLLANKSPFFASDLKMWHEQRRFVVQTLKDLGLGKSKIEGHIQEEIRHFLKVLKQQDGKPLDVMKPLTPSLSNNMSALVFGNRYEYDHPDRVLLDSTMDDVSRTIAQTASHIFFPWIRYIPFLMRWFKFDKIVDACKRGNNLMMKKVEEHKKTLDTKNIRDFIDSYLIEMKTRKEKDADTSFTYDTLIGNTGDLFGAGSETVRTSVAWILYVIAAFPDIQKQVQKEILDIIGSDKEPQILDQKQMPYSHAVLLEIMRWKTTVPLNLLRYTVGDATVCGYNVPKNTIIMANFWAIHHNPKYWQDPDAFKPERFLSADKKSVVKSNYYMPFSVGKRVCPGETMAYMEMFLYFVSILQKFDIRLPDGEKATFDAELFITYKLKPHKLCFFPRNEIFLPK